eukprot:CAMPEP_0184859738 /NCGR_PEP_ID=MMETSP0580-20130426/4727_1 /TAXON_ID=1118495 /ORGANISM="Dactyliosolen fragilissimus" /LENGTH=292 /DNA_ID=CAMNT_0027356541 /DNA_START=449 /DNA_END=1324 /DNA_ORIENTATION=+
MEESNPYLLLREANIARNEARLADLGLLQFREESKNRKRSLNFEEEEEKEKELLRGVGTRRSSRLKLRGNENNLPSRKVLISKTYTGDGMESLGHAVSKSSLQIREKVIVSKKPNQSNSTRNIKIDVRAILFGNDQKKNKKFGYLGRSVGINGKAATIDKSFMMSNQDLIDPLAMPKISFNKYSGVCEWKNATFLWVNIGAPNSNVINNFIGGGMKMTWFGGSRMYNESPVIQHLIETGKRASSNDLKDTDGIILWCRKFDKERKVFEPYICLGRVGYSTHNSASHPIEFIW